MIHLTGHIGRSFQIISFRLLCEQISLLHIYFRIQKDCISSDKNWYSQVLLFVDDTEID